MAGVKSWFLPAVAGALGLAAVAFAACGGNNADPNAGKGTRITDPEKVPSSTPIQNPMLYKIQGDTISTTGGVATVSPGAGGSAATPGSATRRHKVVSGDTCASIAAQYGVTVDALIRSNARIDAGCTNLSIGDDLRIPGPPTPTGGGVSSGTATPKPSGRTYTVQSGDTCDAIARNQGVDVQKLIAANGLDANCTRLQIGQVLQIP